MKKSFVVFNTIILIWSKQIQSILETKGKKVLAIIGLIITTIMAGICGYLVSNEILALFLNGDSKTIYTLFITESVTISTFSFMFFVLVKSITPEQNVITKLLSNLPIKNYEKKLGYYFPQMMNIIICSFALLFILYLPAMFVYKIKLNIILGIIICLLLQTIVITVLLFSVSNLLDVLLKKFSVPYSKGIVNIALVVGFVYYLSNYMNNFADTLHRYKEFKYHIVNITTPLLSLFDKTLPRIRANLFLVFCTIIAVFILFFLVLNISEKIDDEYASRIFCFIKFSKKTTMNLIIKEFKILMRNEEIMVFNIFLLIISVILRINFKLNISNIYVCIIASVISTFSALNAFGMEQAIIPLYKSFGINQRQYTFSKISGNIKSSLLIYSVLLITFFTVNVNWSGVFLGLIILIEGDMILYLIGLVAPNNNMHPYNQGIVIVLIVIFMVPLFYILSKIALLNLKTQISITGLIFVFLIIVIDSVSKKVWNYDC